MPSMRSLVALLPRGALRQLVAAYGLVVADARKTENLQKAVLKGMKSAPGEWLNALPAATLKALAADAGVTPARTTKAALAEALVEATTGGQKKQAAPASGASKAGKAKKGPAARASREAIASAEVAPAKKAKAAALVPARQRLASPAVAVAPTLEAAGAAGHRADEAALAAGSGKRTPAQSKAPVAASPVARPEPEPEPASPPAKAAKKATAPARTRKRTGAGSGNGNGNVQSLRAPDAAQAPESEGAQSDEEPADAAAPKHMLSWSDAVAKAAKRGQSAASMIGQPSAAGPNETTSCPNCQVRVEVQPCSIHTCQHSFVAKTGRKICAECMFERNNMSVETFHERLREDWLCVQCNETVPRPQ